MQTFLPLSDYWASAEVLDYRRLGKQRLEVKQLLLAMGVNVGEHHAGGRAWANHPAAVMWRGHEEALACYGIVICKEWINRGYNDSLLPQFEAVQRALPTVRLPRWFGDERFHRTHRSNLIRKDPAFYRPLWPRCPDNLEYIWPKP